MIKNIGVFKDFSDNSLKSVFDIGNNQIIEMTLLANKKEIEISPGLSEFGYYTMSTIINNGDSIGSVIILSLDTPMLEQEEKLGMILANMLSNFFV